MGELDLLTTTQTEMTSKVDDYSVSSETLDTASETKETPWDFPDFPKYLGYYKQIGPLKQTVDAIAKWTTGKGWTANTEESITDNTEDI